MRRTISPSFRRSRVSFLAHLRFVFFNPQFLFEGWKRKGGQNTCTSGWAGRQESHGAVKHFRTPIFEDFEEEADDLVDIKINVVQTTVENFSRLCILDFGEPLSGLGGGIGCRRVGLRKTLRSSILSM